MASTLQPVWEGGLLQDGAPWTHLVPQVQNPCLLLCFVFFVFLLSSGPSLHRNNLVFPPRKPGAAGKNTTMHLHPCKRLTFRETMVLMDVCVRAHTWAKFKAKQQLVLVVLPRRLPSKCDKKFCRQPLSKSGKLPFYGCHMSSKGAGRRISVS